MKCLFPKKKCNIEQRTEFEDDHFICISKCNDCDIKCDHIRLCINSSSSSRMLEMTEKEGLLIARGLLSALYSFAFNSKEE